MFTLSLLVGNNIYVDFPSIGFISTLTAVYTWMHLHSATFEEKWVTLRRKSFENLAPKRKGLSTAFSILISSLFPFSWLPLNKIKSRNTQTKPELISSSPPVPNCCSHGRKEENRSIWLRISFTEMCGPSWWAVCLLHRPLHHCLLESDRGNS